MACGLESAWTTAGMGPACETTDQFDSVLVVDSLDSGGVLDCERERNPSSGHVRLELFGDDDTTNDPPEIETFQQLAKALAHSQRILRRYQLSLKNHAARQLVPVRLDQMTRRMWAEMEGDQVT